MATEKKLIDANALQFEPDENGIANNIWVGGRNGGKTMNMILYNLKKMIENAPTVDAVEVVRCKDCTHCDPERKHCDHPMGTTLPLRRKADDFCSYGERSTDA